MEEQVIELLRAWSAGDEAAHAQLVTLVYDELRRQARHYRRLSRSDDHLHTTALVHEMYLRLRKIGEIDWQSRSHFFALSAQLMRRILVDGARAQTRLKRGGEVQHVFTPDDWQEIAVPLRQNPEETIILDDLLKRLSAMDPRRGQIVELRVFGGLGPEESAEALGISVSTVGREWKLARAWLLRELKKG